MEKIVEVVVHSFKIGDVDDHEIYAAEPILSWQNSPSGEWIMKHATEPPVWYSSPNMYHYYTYKIKAKLLESDYIFWKLKYT